MFSWLFTAAAAAEAQLHQRSHEHNILCIWFHALCVCEFTSNERAWCKVRVRMCARIPSARLSRVLPSSTSQFTDESLTHKSHFPIRKSESFLCFTSKFTSTRQRFHLFPANALLVYWNMFRRCYVRWRQRWWNPTLHPHLLTWDPVRNRRNAHKQTCTYSSNDVCDLKYIIYVQCYRMESERLVCFDSQPHRMICRHAI